MNTKILVRGPFGPPRLGDLRLDTELVLALVTMRRVQEDDVIGITWRRLYFASDLNLKS